MTNQPTATPNFVCILPIGRNQDRISDVSLIRGLGATAKDAQLAAYQSAVLTYFWDNKPGVARLNLSQCLNDLRSVGLAIGDDVTLELSTGDWAE